MAQRHTDNLESGIDDYRLVLALLDAMAADWRAVAPPADLAEAVGLSLPALKALARRYSGLSAGAFLHALSLDHVKTLAAAAVRGEAGKPARRDIEVSVVETPFATARTRGAGLDLLYGWHPSPFGPALVMADERGLAGLAFADAFDDEACLADMTERWPAAAFARDDAGTLAIARRVFDPALWSASSPLPVHLIGTPFEISVWRRLLAIPLGGATTYSALSAEIGAPKAFRAVGTAVGRNPISFVVPCHRALGRDGGLHGYHWGLPRKRAMLAWEAGRA